jgi:hypothetical protein
LQVSRYARETGIAVLDVDDIVVVVAVAGSGYTAAVAAWLVVVPVALCTWEGPHVYWNVGMVCLVVDPGGGIEC